MRNLIKNKKKKGFTLIEMVAVVAIIGILAAILVPKITGYLNEAKKTAIIDQARKVAQAYETAVMKNTLELKGGQAGDEIDKTTKLNVALESGDNKGNTTMKSLIEDSNSLTNLGKLSEVEIQHCIAITNGSDFEVIKNDTSGEMELKISSIDLSYASK
ncbi:type II secretion system protein [Clostridium thermobutyricum]